MKSYRVYVNLDGFSHNPSGSRKVWRSDLQKTYCCEMQPSVFIWEKASKQNNFDPYQGYVLLRDVEEASK